MKKINYAPFAFLMTVLVLSSCEAVAGIFKAGMGFGVFIAVAAVILLVILIVRMGRKNQ